MGARSKASEREEEEGETLVEGETEVDEGAPDDEGRDEALVEPEVRAELPVHPMLQCPICSVRVKDHRCDPCGHTACFQCLNNLRQSGINCHVCQGPILNISIFHL